MISEVKSGLNSEDPYSAITTVGDERLFEFIPDLYRLMGHSDPMVRWNAIGVLFTRFKLGQEAKKCFDLAKNDPDTLVRGIALCGIGTIIDQVSDEGLRKAIANLLLDVLNDGEESLGIRGCAYAGIEAAMDVPRENRVPANRYIVIEKDVDLHLLENFKKKHLE